MVDRREKDEMSTAGRAIYQPLFVSTTDALEKPGSSHHMSWTACRKTFHPFEQRQIDWTIRILSVQIALHGIGPDRASAMADPQVAALDAVFALHQHSWSLCKSAAGIAVPEDVGKVRPPDLLRFCHDTNS